MLIFKNIIILGILLMLTMVLHPYFVALIIFLVSFFSPIYIVGALTGYFLDYVFLSGREPLFIKYTILFAILVFIAQYIRKRLVR